MEMLWWYIFGILFSIIAGGTVFVGTYSIYDMIRTWWIKKHIPQDKKELATPGDVKINDKEVEEDERRKFNKFREFEKLRRLAESQGGARTDEARLSIAETKAELSRRDLLQDNANSNIRGNAEQSSKDAGGTSQSGRVSKVYRPEFG